MYFKLNFWAPPSDFCYLLSSPSLVMVTPPFQLLFSCLVVSDFLQPHGLYHTRFLCLSRSPWVAPLMSIGSVMPSNHLILCHTLLLLPSIFPSIRVFSNELALCIRWPKYWSFSSSVSTSNENSGLISFRIDWFDVLAVQGTLQESSPAPQFESINSLTLSLLYGSILTSK